jgi:hypothetical protein
MKAHRDCPRESGIPQIKMERIKTIFAQSFQPCRQSFQR